MFNGTAMDPEMFRIAQEQMSRMSPQDIAKIRQQVFSNPGLMKLASESMKNMRPEDMRMASEQLKHIRPEDMAEMGEKISKASPDEIAALHAHAEAQASYELNAAQMLKQKGNELHNLGKFHDAAEKYIRAKNNLNGIPLFQCQTLRTQCSLNLMSCYLKTRQFSECIEEGSLVLAYDPMNVKALYRRGQAYKEIGKLEFAMSDLRKAHEASPDDETIADAWRDARDKFIKSGDQNSSGGIIIEEVIDDDEQQPLASSSTSDLTTEDFSRISKIDSHSSSSSSPENGHSDTNDKYFDKMNNESHHIREFQKHVAADASPEAMTAFGASGMPPEMIKIATDMLKNMKPDEVTKMLHIASSMNMKRPTNSMMAKDIGSGESQTGFPEMTPEMISMASETLGKMSPEEIQKMVEAASSLNNNSSRMRNVNSNINHQSSTQSSHANCISSLCENTSADLPDSAIGTSPSSYPAPTADLQETMRNSMRDPAMRQMFSSMMRSMSPEMMANMSEQFGVKISKEEAAKAQQAMSSLSPDDLEKLMRWTEKAQKGIETARKTKNWLLGKPGMILAICMLLLAAILHRLGFIGG